MDNNSKLLNATLEGDENAFNEIREKTIGGVTYVAKSILSNEQDVEDAVQETYIKIYKNLSKLEDANKLQSWANSIAINSAKDIIKKKKPLLFSEIMDEEETPDEKFKLIDVDREIQPQESLDLNETQKIVKDILNTLPEEQRLCVTMRYFQNMKIKEIADELGVSESTVKSRLRYAESKIKAEVLEVEKKGVSLHGLTPVAFFIYAFKNGVNIPTVSASVAAGTAAASTAGSGLAVKILAGALAASIAVGGGVIGVKKLKEKNIIKTPSTTVSETQNISKPQTTKAVKKEKQYPIDVVFKNIPHGFNVVPMISPQFMKYGDKLYYSVHVKDKKGYFIDTKIMSYNVKNKSIHTEYSIGVNATYEIFLQEGILYMTGNDIDANGNPVPNGGKSYFYNFKTGENTAISEDKLSYIDEEYGEKTNVIQDNSGAVVQYVNQKLYFYDKQENMFYHNTPDQASLITNDIKSSNNKSAYSPDSKLEAFYKLSGKEYYVERYFVIPKQTKSMSQNRQEKYRLITFDGNKKKVIHDGYAISNYYCHQTSLILDNKYIYLIDLGKNRTGFVLYQFDTQNGKIKIVFSENENLSKVHYADEKMVIYSTYYVSYDDEDNEYTNYMVYKMNLKTKQKTKINNSPIKIRETPYY